MPAQLYRAAQGTLAPVGLRLGDPECERGPMRRVDGRSGLRLASRYSSARSPFPGVKSDERLEDHRVRRSSWQRAAVLVGELWAALHERCFRLHSLNPGDVQISRAGVAGLATGAKLNATVELEPEDAAADLARALSR